MSESNNNAVQLHRNENLPQNAFTKLPQTFEEAKKYCNYLAGSALVPKAYQGKPQDVFVALSWGQEVGLYAMNSLRNIAVINGRASMWGDAPIAIVRSHPKCEFILEDNEAFAYARDHIPGWEHLKDKNPDNTSICVGKRVGEQAQAREFSVEDVKRAKLGNVHNQYPKDMRKYKARSRLIDSVFPDLVMGLGQAELVKENEELHGEPEVTVKDDAMADDVLSQVSGKPQKKNPEEAAEDVDFEEVPDEEEPETKTDKKDSGKKDRPSTEEEIQHLLETAKYLSKEQQGELIKEADKDIPHSRAEYWKGEIRKAYSEARKAKTEQK